MQMLLKATLSRLSVYALVTCLPILFSLPTFADEIPAGWESYLDRPDILQVEAKEQNLDGNWQKLKEAHFTMVAELLEFYPKDTHIYFLARDSEHLYDVARLVTQGQKDSSRMHLLNVSRANMRDKNLKAYLAENGISENLLEKGKKVLFVDTGFAGTIPRVIAEGFKPELRDKLKTHLVVSSNPNHPSTRGFLVHLNPSVISQNPSGMHGTIISYEHMPRYTDRSSQYINVEGVHHPISPIGKSSDGSVSKELSLKYMKDIKAHWRTDGAQSKFAKHRAKLKLLKNILVKGEESSVKKLTALLLSNDKTAEHFLIEAQIRDFLEMKSNAGFKVNVTLDALGLKGDQDQSSGFVSSKKNELIKKFPEWGTILENPDDQIPKLFTEKNYQMVGNLIDANVDAEINELLAKSLYDSPDIGLKKDLQTLMIEKADSATLQFLAEKIFSQPHTKDMTDLLRLVIERADSNTLNFLAKYTFSQDHTKDMADLLRLVVEKTKPTQMRFLAMGVFSRRHSKDRTDLLRLVIEKAEQTDLEFLATRTFSQPHTKDMTDLLRLVIEKADQQTLQHLAKGTFSQPHTEHMTDLLRLVIEKADATTLLALASETFSQPHTKDMTDLLRLLIAKADSMTLHVLASDTFSQPHTKDMTDLLRLVIEKANPANLQSLSTYTFSRNHAKSEVHIKLLDSLKILDANERKAFLDLHLPNETLPQSPAVKTVSAQLQPSEMVMIKNRHFKVLKRAGEGRRGVVFQVQAENGAVYALKTLKTLDQESRDSLAKESLKALDLQKLKIPHAKVLVQEKDYVLKPWINGVRGDEVIEMLSKGKTEYKLAADSLISLVTKIRNKGAYVGDFRPANLIWNNKAWIVVDSGSVQDGMTFEEAKLKWAQADARGPKFERRWQMPLPRVAPISCQGIFSKAG